MRRCSSRCIRGRSFHATSELLCTKSSTSQTTVGYFLTIRVLIREKYNIYVDRTVRELKWMKCDGYARTTLGCLFTVLVLVLVSAPARSPLPSSRRAARPIFVRTQTRANNEQISQAMPPRSSLANISFTVDSASEDDMTHDELNAIPTPDSNTENKFPVRKQRAQGTQLAVTTKPPARGRPVSRRVSASSILSAKTTARVAKRGPVKGQRKALAERNNKNNNNTNESDTEEVDDLDHEASAEHPKHTKRGRPAKKTQEEATVDAPVPTKRGRRPGVKESTANENRKANTKAKTRRSISEPAAERGTVPETQPVHDLDAMEMEDSVEIDETPESMPPPSRTYIRRTQLQSNGTQQTSNGPGRAGSVSDSERDPVLRRKLGDLTRKLEAMTARYDALREAASVGKESNFEQLRQRTEQMKKGMFVYHMMRRILRPFRPRYRYQDSPTAGCRVTITYLRCYFDETTARTTY